MSPRLAFRCRVVLAFFLTAVFALAEVTRVEITSRTDVGTSGYEKILGKLHFAVDPKHERNRVIADIELAPVNVTGRVEFSADLYILRPKDPARSNGAAIVEVSNRGGKGVLTSFNRGAKADPTTEADLGDGFLTQQGYTLVWVGWEFDVPPTPGLLRIEVPFATEKGQPITGPVRAQFVVDTPTKTYTVTDLAAYPFDPALSPAPRLTAGPTRSPRTGRDVEVIDRAAWKLTGHTLTLESGFQPGRYYELSYTAKNPPIAGLGFAAIRDAAAWLRTTNEVIPPVRHLYAFGISQSGRFLRDFLYHGFNTDEKDRAVYDGVMAHIAGAARLDFNRRWSTPRSLGLYPVTGFPFADTAQNFGGQSRVEGLLENPRAKHVPKIFYTNTSVEYVGGGRVAALVHVSPDGDRDLVLPETVRFYAFAGTQHGPGRFPPPAPTNTQERVNPANYWWIMRALLPAMHDWVAQGTPPPASVYPALRDKTLVTPGQNFAAPALPVFAPLTQPGFAAITGPRAGNPLIPDFSGPRALPLWIPQVDADGNELGGIRLPEVAVPLATYTGWNFRSPAAGSPHDLVMLMGSWIPFARTAADRAAVKDPRPSIAERYSSLVDYLTKIDAASATLVAQRLLRSEDLPAIRREAATRWDYLMTDGKTAPKK